MSDENQPDAEASAVEDAAADAASADSSAADSVAAQRIEIIGDATPEQVAALVAVLSAASGGATEVTTRHTSPWSSPAGLVRRPMTPGPGVWARSLRS